ncbi:MAG: hypothetical protein P8J87_01595 [Verrucomicrobiales bacterium]|nr:hypothetical protein [Verrucomicrobiales bacterium]
MVVFVGGDVGRAFLGCDFNCVGGAAAVEDRAEPAHGARAFYGGDGLVTEDEAADIGIAGLFDELLAEAVRIECEERLR